LFEVLRILLGILYSYLVRKLYCVALAYSCVEKRISLTRRSDQQAIALTETALLLH